jgi:hypothetical protein
MTDVVEIVIAIVLVAAAGFGVVLAGRIRRGQFARIAAIAPGQYTFIFTSNRFYQEAFLEMQRQKIIDPAVQSDDSSPVTRGPRWASASSSGLSIWRGYDAVPLVTLPWTKVGTITSGYPIRRGNSYGALPSVTVNLLGSGGALPLVLPSADPGSSFGGSVKEERAVAGELNRIRRHDDRDETSEPRLI